jgi:hypothetical protein
MANSSCSGHAYPSAVHRANINALDEPQLKLAGICDPNSLRNNIDCGRPLLTTVSFALQLRLLFTMHDTLY